VNKHQDTERSVSLEDAINCEGRRIKHEYRVPKETGSTRRRPRSSSNLSTTHPTRTSLAMNSVIRHRGRRLTASAMARPKISRPHLESNCNSSVIHPIASSLYRLCCRFMGSAFIMNPPFMNDEPLLNAAEQSSS
jgi:hypothetical protein